MRYAIIGFVFFSSAAFAFMSPKAPPAITHHYGIYLQDKKVGDVDQTISIVKDHYAMTSITHAKVWFYQNVVTEKSEGEVLASQFQVMQYQKTDQHKKINMQMHVNWIDRKVIMTDARGVRSSPFTPPLYDNLNYQLQLPYDYLAHHDLEYDVLTEKGITSYDFHSIGVQMLPSAKGPVHTQEFCSDTKQPGIELCLWYKHLLLIQSATIKNGKLIERTTLD